ncbi:hypothetical protein GCM10008023_18890 [Sphingomonas glacialis]|uniref:DUF4169 family protein n=1 Tax=Sphingomonas glacialis TaxID=658225 RepID=A0ABQ3LHB8_9SPHN|nr:DUF4169 family protein [Sphingomonas glacialis]GHH15685.1 hypothetical protein GCM10008023_18890 [Sphingomonas glacialis]
MGEVVNLRRARKARARDTAETTAATNRAAFGRSKAERAATAHDAARAGRALDGAKREE